MNEYKASKRNATGGSESLFLVRAWERGPGLLEGGWEGKGFFVAKTEWTDPASYPITRKESRFIEREARWWGFR